MKVIKLDQNSDEWFEFRRGKISGSKLKNIVVKRGTDEKQGFYQLLADRLTIKEADDEDAKDRGHRLENEAIDRFIDESGVEINKEPGVWVSDSSDQIIVSPDGASDDNTLAVEIKCLASWHQVRAIVENERPKGKDSYEFQIMQYFIVNENLQTLFFVMYDDRLVPEFQYKSFEITREQLAEDIENYKQYEIAKIKKIEQILGRIF